MSIEDLVEEFEGEGDDMPALVTVEDGISPAWVLFILEAYLVSVENNERAVRELAAVVKSYDPDDDLNTLADVAGALTEFHEMVTGIVEGKPVQ